MISETAQRLIEARRTRRCTSVIDACPLDAPAAYAAQDDVARTFGWFGGAAARYWKSGGPSREAILTHAPLPPDGVWPSPAVASQWPFHMRGIEAEIALRLGEDIDAARASSLDLVQTTALIDGMCVSIEIVDSRWQEGLESPALAKLADLQSHGALVLGEWVPFDPPEWSQQLCRVQIGESPLLVCRGSHPLGDPAYVLPAWLRHLTRHGDRIAAGTTVTTGTWVGILQAEAGDLVLVDFPGIGAASIQL